MNLKKWEEIIQTITDAFNLETKESGQINVLTNWRKSLAKDPYVLQPFQIDEIVREVRKRVMSARQPVKSNTPAV